MEATKTDKINFVYVKITRAGKLFIFDAGELSLNKNDSVVIETERGLGIGTVVQFAAATLPQQGEQLPKVIRVATDEDYKQLERNKEKENNTFQICQKKIKELNLPMKLIDVEFSLGGGKASFFFSSEGRVDFRELVKSLALELHTKIEMCQIGVRDEAKMVGGVGICGKEFCCASFLRDFAPVSIKMAKVQNLALNPQKVSGGCGRLLCCLAYEFLTYENLGRDLPKLGKKIHTPKGEGRVKFVDIFKGKIQVEYEDGSEEIVDVAQLQNQKTEVNDEK